MLLHDVSAVLLAELARSADVWQAGAADEPMNESCVLPQCGVRFEDGVGTGELEPDVFPFSSDLGLDAAMSEEAFGLEILVVDHAVSVSSASRAATFCSRSSGKRWV